MPWGAVLGFWGVSALFVVTPGADWAYAISAGMQQRSAPAVIGLLSGHVVATLVVAAGVGALITSVPTLLGVLTAAGAGYLVWLGVSALRHPPVVASHDALASGSGPAWVIRGFGVSGLNPKVFLLFIALLPQFTSASAPWPLPLQIAGLGALHVLSCAIVYSAVAVGARVVLVSRPAAARIVGRISGIAMLTIGILLIAERIREALLA